MPQSADATRANLYAVPEVSHGVTPAAPAMSRWRQTGNDLGLSINPLQSAELKGNRMPATLRHGTRSVAGEVSSEFAYGWIEPYLEAALCGAWTAPAAAANKVTWSAASADNSFNDSGGATPVVVAGDFIFTNGFATAANNGWFKVVSRTANKIVVTGGTLVVEVAGASARIQPMAKLGAGTTRRSFSLLREFADIVGAGNKAYHLYAGCEINTLAVAVKPDGIVSAKFGIIGRNMSLADAAPAGAVLGAANQNQPMDSFAGVVLEGGSVNTLCTSLDFNLANGIAPRWVIGSDLSLEPSIAESALTGTAVFYFASAAMMDKFLNETGSSLVVGINDNLGNTFVFEFPNIKYSDGKAPVATGPIFLSMPFTAQEEVVAGVGTGTHVRIWKAPMP